MSDDPYKYFRVEAREILDDLSAAVLRLEKTAGDKAQAHVERLMRLAHTLKGAAGVVDLGDMAEHAHAIEDVLAPYRDGLSAGERVNADQIDGILALIDALETDFSGVDSPAKPSETTDIDDVADASREDVSDPRLEVVRVGIDQMNGLVSGLAQAEIEAAGLDDDVAELTAVDGLLAELDGRLGIQPREDGYGLDPKQALADQRRLVEQLRQTLADTRRRLADRAQRVRRELEAVRDDADHIRLVPAAVLEPVLERVARDAGRRLDKQVDFEFHGAQVRLDAAVLAAVRQALVHLVRCACRAGGHGLAHQGGHASTRPVDPGQT